MDRRRRLGTRPVLVLVTLVAILSFLVGVINMANPQANAILRGFVPSNVQQAAGFTGAMTGFILLMGAFGLRRGYRVAWYLTVILLPVTAFQGLIQGGSVTLGTVAIPVSLPLVVFSVLAIPSVVYHRGRFNQQFDLSTSQWAALGALLGAQVYGTAGTYALREQFPQVDTLLDAFYFTLVTASTVGYGDLTAQTQVGRLFSMSVLIIGVASFGLAAGTLLGPAIEARFAAALGTMTDSELSMLENHIIVLGYGELTEPILEELDNSDISYIVVTPDSERAASLRSRDIKVLTGDPSDEQPLHDAGIERAIGVVAATNNDAEDALAILTARELNPDVRIVAAATQRENSRKLKRAGADAVISPAVIGGHLLVQSALGQSGAEGIADRLTGIRGDQVEEVAEEVDDAADDAQ